MKMRALILAAVLVAVAACASSSDISTFPGLQTRVEDYYALEKRGDWNATYGFRTNKFRESVPKETYISLMKRDSAGWTLIGYRINCVERAGEVVKISMTFTEKAPSSFMPALKDVRTEEFELEDESLWVQEQGVWYCRACGVRGHLSLNSSVVAP